MDRLLVLRLETTGCTAEASLNGVLLARAGGARPGVVSIPVHEYTVQGANELELTIEPAPPGSAAEPEPRITDGHGAASVRLLLPRVGQAAHPASARTLAQIDWAPPADEVVEMPFVQRSAVDLPISFPRWRWMDAPPIIETPALKAQVATFLQGLALGLARGNPEPFVQAARLRFEELALAYQRNLADDVARWRTHVQQLHAALPLKPALPSAPKLLLRPLAGGRLLECLTPAGEPVLQSPSVDAAGGPTRVFWPVRLASVEGRFYVMR